MARSRKLKPWQPDPERILRVIQPTPSISVGVSEADLQTYGGRVYRQAFADGRAVGAQMLGELQAVVAEYDSWDELRGALVEGAFAAGRTQALADIVDKLIEATNLSEWVGLQYADERAEARRVVRRAGVAIRWGKK